jgi:hypothetical protein
MIAGIVMVLSEPGATDPWSAKETFGVDDAVDVAEHCIHAAA